ncbi:hypothetical protein NX059_011894 [Plenodomus lindquistii]|nr:hypothetical protein NX059_011894 [Plenodomus lindquistii]
MDTESDNHARTVELLNDELAKSARLSTYTRVQVLVLYWQGEVEGFKDEGLQLGEFFGKSFNYAVEYFEIPRSESYLRLHHFITQKSLALSEYLNEGRGMSLLIIHYGGHGDRNDRKHEGEEKRAVWASDAEGTKTLPWYKIQDDLNDLDIELFLILDCCFAAQAGRADSRPLGKAEFLAAAAMGSVTPRPGEKSFTVALIKEAARSLREDGFVIIIDLHARLMDRASRLHATPIHKNLRPGKRSIRLEPLSKSNAVVEAEPYDTPSVSLLLRTRGELEQLNLQEFVQWLGVDRPRDIDSVTIVETTSHIETFVASLKFNTSPLAKAVRKVSRDDVLKAWERIASLVEQCSLLQNQPRSDPQLLRSRFEEILEQLDETNNSFVETLERSVIAVNSIDEKKIVDDAIVDPAAGYLGITKALRLRQVIYSAPESGLDLQEIGSPAMFSRGIQEEKKYGGQYSQEEKDQLQARIRHLAILLSEHKDAGFQTLRCYGCEHKPFYRSYVLHFEIPESYETNDGRRDLTTLIEKTKGRARPTLDERLKMAFHLAKAVHKWHSVGWLHQGIGSPNIHFLRWKDSDRIDFTNPFIMGFDFARPDSDPSLGFPTKDPLYDIYRHPSRQGPARKGHRKTHDYYSLGVVLLEIGLWQSAIKMVARRGENTSPSATMNSLQKDASERLAHFAGSAYQKAVELCLSSQFEIDSDDKSDSRLLNKFHSKVVMEIARGIKIH